LKSVISYKEQYQIFIYFVETTQEKKVEIFDFSALHLLYDSQGKKDRKIFF
jgi:hypothetical protein